jgi:hypothetical protein
MQISTLVAPAINAEDQTATAFYRRVLEVFNTAGLPYLVGGAYAFSCYTGIHRHTKDLDLFIRRQDYDMVRAALLKAGYETKLAFPHWLAKISSGPNFIDIIFSSGNGVAEVDDIWFEHAVEARVLDVPVKICPVEETIWSKAFIMERERYDGADIAHLLRGCGKTMDWQRLLRRFEPHWRVLFSHLILFGFVYPAHRDLVPAGLMDELIERLRSEAHAPPPHNDLCLGTLLSREQYLTDTQQLGYQDGRLIPFGNMTPEDMATWTQAIRDNDKEA